MKHTFMFLLSVIFPGLGHLLQNEIKKGFLFLFSFFTIIFIFIWRINILSYGEGKLITKYSSALKSFPLFVIFLSVLIFLIWIKIILNLKDKKNISCFVLIFFTLFSLGWQISSIDVYKASVKLPEAWTPLSKILWPWEAAISHETKTVKASYIIRVGKTGPLPENNKESKSAADIFVNKSWGYLSSIDDKGKIKNGSLLKITGKNFKANTKTEIWWIDQIGNEFRPRQNSEYAYVITDDKGSFSYDLIMPYRIIPPSSTGPVYHTIEARQISRTGAFYPSKTLLTIIERMIETIFMGMMATIFGILLSIPISFLSSRNLMSGSGISMTIYFFTRTILNIIRSIEPLIWALIAVVWVGLGPFAGVIALTLHSIAALGKLYSEAIENINPGPIEAIKATGANNLQVIFYGVIPQMISPFISFSIYRWDINVRMSTIIGLVGGGGIGFILVQHIRLLDYRAAGIAVWFIAITVSVLDYISSEIRQKFT